MNLGFSASLGAVGVVLHVGGEMEKKADAWLMSSNKWRPKIVASKGSWKRAFLSSFKKKS